MAIPSDNQQQIACQILLPFAEILDRQAPEYTIHQLRDQFLSNQQESTVNQFTFGLRFLLEKKYLRRLNDERLELTPGGREWFTPNIDQTD